MKVSRAYPPSIAAALVFALMATAARTGDRPEVKAAEQIGSARQREETKTSRPRTVVTRGKTATVILHGLMVGRFKEKKDGISDMRFDVGVVRRAPGHRFSFSVYGNPYDCASEAVVKSEIKLDSNTYDFELVGKSGRTLPSSIKKYLPPKSTGNSQYEAYNNILDVEGQLHPKDLKIYKNAFSHVFYFHAGDVKTRCSTGHIEALRKEGEASEQSQATVKMTTMAEVVEVDVTLSGEQSLVLKNKDGEVIWRHEYCPEGGKAEARLLNLPRSHKEEREGLPARFKDYECICSDDYEMRDEPTDFQLYYYLVFDVDRPDRFELINTDECVKHPLKVTTPPYKCGMVRVDSLEIGLD
ncbi:MAG: hypothetical protein ACLGJB_23320 [Blastocatellia bacterium]